MPEDLTPLELFDLLCEAPKDVIESTLSSHPPAVVLRVRALLSADASTDTLTAADVQWSIAAVVPPLHESRPPPPPVVGGYRLFEPLGHGGMGRVFEAEQPSLCRRVALKILHTSGEAGVQAALVEAQALARLNDPRIPHVIEVGSDGGLAFLAMELVAGVDVRTWSTGRSVRTVLRMVADIAHGVAVAHRAGVLHRDLKPTNILVDDRDRPHIVDFGLATGLDRASAPAGTLPYLPPEVLRGEGPSAAGDVHALGVILHELLVGERPYADARFPTTAQELKARDGGIRGLPRNRGSAGVNAIVALALAPLGQRYESAVELSADLEAYLANQPTRALPPGWIRWMSMWATRNRRLLVIGSLSAGIAAGGMLVWSALVEQQKTRAEQDRHVRASQRLLTLQEHLEPRYQAGDFEGAAERLQTFVDQPDVQTTRAVSDAWLLHHDRLVAADQDDLAWPFLARASLSATSEQRPIVRAAIARRLHAESRWSALARLLEREVPTETLALRGSTLLALRRFDEALPHLAPEVVPVVEHLSEARRFPYRPAWVTPVQLDSGPALALMQQDEGLLTFVRPNAQLTPIFDVPLPAMNFQHGNPLLTRSQPPVLLGFDPGTTGPLRMWKLESRDLVAAGSLPIAGSFLGGATMALAGGDPYGLFVGTLYPGRAVWWADPAQQTAERIDLPHGSDVHGVQAVDLDRDGVDELIVATGLWAGDALHILRREGGAIVQSERLRFRGPPSFGVLERDGVRLLLVVTGAPRSAATAGARLEAGVHVYEIRDDGSLTERHHLVMPTHEGVGAFQIGDLDGDGRQEAAIELSGATHHLAVVSFDDALRPSLSRIAGLVLVAVDNLDDDPADEVLVRLTDDDHHLWVLGLEGGASLPQWAPTPPRSVPHRRGEAVAELVDLGLDVEIADALKLATDRPSSERAADLAFAGELLEQQRHFTDAVELYDAALAAGPADPLIQASRDRAARTAHRTGQPDVFVDFAAELPKTLAIRRGAALRHHPGVGLAIDAVVADGVLLDFGVNVGDEGVGLEFALNVTHLEAGLRLVVEVVAPDGEAVHQLDVHGWGGNLRTDRVAGCMGNGTQQHVQDYGDLMASPHPPTRFTLRADRRDTEQLCELRREGRHRSLGIWVAPSLPAGPHRVVVRVEGEYEGGHLQAVLETLSLWRATPLPSHTADSHHRLRVLGNYEEALARTLDTPDRVEVAMSLRDVRSATALLRDADSRDPSLQRALIGGLRRDPNAWLPVLDEVFPTELPDLYVRAWGSALHHHREASVVQSIHHPFVDAFEPTTTALAQLLYHRAALVQRDGQLQRARRLLTRVLPFAEGTVKTDVRVQLALVSAEIGDAVGARGWCVEALASDADQRVEDLLADDPLFAAACKLGE